MAGNKKHWITSPAPGIVFAAVVLSLVLTLCARASRHDVHPAQTFRTTDLLVDNVTSLGNVATLVNEAFATPSGSVNNFDPWSGGTHTSRLEIDTTSAAAPFNITGIVAGNDGDLLYIWNGGGNNNVPFTFTNQDTGSSALNRFHLPFAGPYMLGYQSGALFIYLGGFGWSLLHGDGGNVMPIQLALMPTRPTALANGSTTNDYDPWGSTFRTPSVYQDTGAASTITGIAAPQAGGVGFAVGNDGTELNFVNISTTGTITITCNAAGSLAENRIYCSTSIVLTPYSSVRLLYDTTVSGGWRVGSLALSP
jgi:hypothetical protein